ncbi:hypothetical protein FF38_06770 [Lucilia cuprina]|uniref:Uncharacterized protein n=1 Tax=Lucilia cuprina TaxID=7375 RepID=A0A0L0CTX3_LUCCU|nr:hypothetical protein FF38_06770 [Lucilia cuprina]
MFCSSWGWLEGCQFHKNCSCHFVLHSLLAFVDHSSSFFPWLPFLFVCVIVNDDHGDCIVGKYYTSSTVNVHQGIPTDRNKTQKTETLKITKNQQFTIARVKYLVIQKEEKLRELRTLLKIVEIARLFRLDPIQLYPMNRAFGLILTLNLDSFGSTINSCKLRLRALHTI